MPRIAEAPAALECRHYPTLEVRRARRLAIGEVVHVHVRAGIVDPEKMRVDMTHYRPLARLFGNFYASLGEPFTMVRQSYEEWLAAKQKRQARLNCTAPSAIVTAAWVGSITGMPSASSSGLRWRAMPAQPITIAFGAVLLLQRAADLDHARQRLFAAGGFGDRHFERTLAGEPVGQPHLAQIAHVAGDRALLDRDHAEALCAARARSARRIRRSRTPAASCPRGRHAGPDRCSRR